MKILLPLSPLAVYIETNKMLQNCLKIFILVFELLYMVIVIDSRPDFFYPELGVVPERPQIPLFQLRSAMSPETNKQVDDRNIKMDDELQYTTDSPTTETPQTTCIVIKVSDKMFGRYKLSCKPVDTKPHEVLEPPLEEIQIGRMPEDDTDEADGSASTANIPGEVGLDPAPIAPFGWTDKPDSNADHDGVSYSSIDIFSDVSTSSDENKSILNSNQNYVVSVMDNDDINSSDYAIKSLILSPDIHVTQSNQNVSLLAKYDEPKNKYKKKLLILLSKHNKNFLRTGPVYNRASHHKRPPCGRVLRPGKSCLEYSCDKVPATFNDIYGIIYGNQRTICRPTGRIKLLVGNMIYYYIKDENSKHRLVKKQKSTRTHAKRKDKKKDKFTTSFLDKTPQQLNKHKAVDFSEKLEKGLLRNDSPALVNANSEELVNRLVNKLGDILNDKPNNESEETTKPSFDFNELREKEKKELDDGQELMKLIYGDDKTKPDEDIETTNTPDRVNITSEADVDKETDINEEANKNTTPEEATETSDPDKDIEMKESSYQPDLANETTTTVEANKMNNEETETSSMNVNPSTTKETDSYYNPQPSTIKGTGLYYNPPRPTISPQSTIKGVDYYYHPKPSAIAGVDPYYNPHAYTTRRPDFYYNPAATAVSGIKYFTFPTESQQYPKPKNVDGKIVASKCGPNKAGMCYKFVPNQE